MTRLIPAAVAFSHGSTDAGSVGGEYARGPAEPGAEAFVGLTIAYRFLRVT